MERHDRTDAKGDFGMTGLTVEQVRDWVASILDDLGIEANDYNRHKLRVAIKSIAIQALTANAGWRPIESAPRDGTEVLIYARWDWDNMDMPSNDYYWAVAVWRKDASYDDECNEVGNFASVSSNPYTDYAVDPLGWMPLPAPPHVAAGGL